jgi:chromosome partitioning protein
MSALSGEAALDLADVLAQPFIAMRNDHQDALGAGLAVSEYAPSGKSADEIRDLWRWIETRLNGGIAAGEQLAREDAKAEFPIMFVPTLAEKVPAAAAAAGPLPARPEADASWDACL